MVYKRKSKVYNNKTREKIKKIKFICNNNNLGKPIINKIIINKSQNLNQHKKINLISYYKIRINKSQNWMIKSKNRTKKIKQN